MYGNAGDFFFHYTTRAAAFEHILPERRLRLSPYFRMRDPLEAKAPDLGAGYLVPPDENLEQKLQRSYFEARAEMAAIRRRAKLLSLTIDAAGYGTPGSELFGRGWARARMWEQYAERHRGVCLLFRRAAFEALVLPQLRVRDPGAQSGVVRYTHTGLVEDPARSFTLNPELDGKALAAAHVRLHMNSFFFLKLSDWESEHEYRFVELSDNEEFTYVDIGDTVAAVFVGHEFPEWQEPSLLALCERVGVDARRVEWEYMNRPMPLRLKGDLRASEGVQPE